MLPEPEEYIGHFETDALGLRAPRTDGHLSRSGDLAPAPSQPLAGVAQTQFGLWVLRQFHIDGHSAAIHQGIAIDGNLDYVALAIAFRELVTRNETLRRRFLLIEDSLQSIVIPSQLFNLELVDLSGLAGSCCEITAGRIAYKLCANPLNLERGPLVRVIVMELRAGQNALLLMLDRIVADRWSMALICSEFFRLYSLSNVAQNNASDRNDFTLPDGASEPDEPHGKASWQSRQSALESTFEEASRSIESRPPERVHFYLSADASAMVKSLAARLREHPAGVFLACYYLLLSRLSLSKEVVVCIEGRDRSLESAQFIGPLACKVPVSVSLSDDPAFVTLVSRVSRASRAASDMTETSLEQVFDRVATQLAASQSAHHATFEFVEIVPETLRCPGLRLSPFPIPQIAAESDLDLRVMSQSGLFQCVITCNDLYREIAASIASAFQAVILKTCGDPNSNLSEYDLMADSESLRTLALQSSTEAFGSFADVASEIDRQAAIRPDAVAAVKGNDHLSYGYLNISSNRLALTLGIIGVKAESCVAMLAPRDLATLIGMLGILKAGAIYLPLDPSYPDSQIALMLEDARPTLFLSRASLDSRRAGYTGPILDLEEALAEGDDRCELPMQRPLPDQVAYIMYTSGSTGKPKGVMVTHKGMSGHVFAKASNLAIGVTDIVAQTASCSFDISIWQFLSPLVAGGAVAIFDDDIANDPMLLLEHMGRMDVTVWETVPVLMGILVEELKRLAESRERLPALRSLISNAEALPTDLAIDWQGLYPHVQLLNTYGATEASDDVTHYSVPLNYKCAAVYVPLGTPIVDATVHALDERMRPAAEGIPGEIYFGGQGLARGYVNQPGLTAERFIPNPFSSRPGERLYRTGDLARSMPNGDLDFLGRVDDQTKVRGHRVEPGQVAATIRKHPAVFQAAVISSAAATAETALIGFVVWREGASGDLDDLRGFLDANLPSYMTPAAIIECSELPVNRNGKLDRKSLEAIAGGYRHLAPRTLTETVLAEIFLETLGVSRIGVSDDFFACGGTARRAVLLMTRVQSLLNVEIPLKLIYNARTVETIAKFIDRKSKLAETPVCEDGLTESELHSLLSDHLNFTE